MSGKSRNGSERRGKREPIPAKAPANKAPVNKAATNKAPVNKASANKAAVKATNAPKLTVIKTARAKPRRMEAAPSDVALDETVALQAPSLDNGERDTLQLRVYHALARGLMAGSFRPGQAVTLRTLAAKLGTSAMPVREAVSRLISERALVLLPNRSVIVPRMNRARFLELSRTRQALEGMATEAACTRNPPGLVDRLVEINQALKRAAASRDYPAALMLNMNFHFAIYEAAGTSVLLPLIEMLWRQAGPFLALSLVMPDVRWTAPNHYAAVAALEAKDPAAARRAIELDIEETLQQLLEKADFDAEPATAQPVASVAPPRRAARVGRTASVR
jgi:DNA-binding GntR family transcriptional regulator